jgi:hypothetical protein
MSKVRNLELPDNHGMYLFCNHLAEIFIYTEGKQPRRASFFGVSTFQEQVRNKLEIQLDAMLKERQNKTQKHIWLSAQISAPKLIY